MNNIFKKKEKLYRNGFFTSRPHLSGFDAHTRCFREMHVPSCLFDDNDTTDPTFPTFSLSKQASRLARTVYGAVRRTVTRSRELSPCDFFFTAP